MLALELADPRMLKPDVLRRERSRHLPRVAAAVRNRRPDDLRVNDARGDVPGWRRTALPRLRANGNRGALRRVVAAAAQRDDAADDEDEGSAPHHAILRGRPTSVLDLARQTRSRCEADARGLIGPIELFGTPPTAPASDGSAPARRSRSARQPRPPPPPQHRHPSRPAACHSKGQIADGPRGCREQQPPRLGRHQPRPPRLRPGITTDSDPPRPRPTTAEATGCSQATGAGSPTDHPQTRRPT
jgi:hypothetical protein